MRIVSQQEFCKCDKENARDVKQKAWSHYQEKFNFLIFQIMFLEILLELIQITVICYYLYDGLGAPCTGHVRLCTDDSDTNTTGSTLLDVLGGEPPIGSKKLKSEYYEQYLVLSTPELLIYNKSC